MRRCPICGKRRKMRKQLVYNGPIVLVPALLYQRSYPGEPEYIIPRCLICFEGALEKEGNYVGS